MNRKDPASWATVWADDAAWNLRGDDVVGREAIVELWRSAVGRYELLLQQTTGHLVDELGADHASGRTYFTEIARKLDGSHQTLHAVYHDRYVRTPHGWRFARRELDVLYRSNEPLNGWAKPITLP